MSRRTRSATKALSLSAAPSITTAGSRSRSTKSKAAPAAQPAPPSSTPSTPSTPSTSSTSVKVVALSSAPSAPTSSPSSPPTLLFDTPTAWESWLSQNHPTPSGVWLQIAKKNAPVPSVTYDEALDAAICHGWIDGQRKALDATHFVQRFTPRRKNSLWSRRNVDKVAVLQAAGRMRAPGRAEVDAARADGRWERAYSASSVAEVPGDFAAALAKDRGAERFFEALNRTQRYKFLWRIETVRRPETRRRKIEEFVAVLARHQTL